MTEELSPEPIPGPSLRRATLVMGTGTSLSRATGFVRIAVIAWAIGGVESKLPDTYQLANTLPNIVYQLILGEILATIFVPVFVEYVTKKNADETHRLASTMVTLTLIIATAISVLAVLAAPWLMKMYTFRLAGADALAQQEVGTFLLRLLLPQMIFYATGTVLTGLLNAHKKFGLPMFAPVLNNLIVIGTFIVFKSRQSGGVPGLGSISDADMLLLGLGTTAGIVVMTLVLVPAVLRMPQRYRLVGLDLGHPALKQVGSLATFALLYVIVNQVGLYVVKLLANGEQGGVAAYDTSFVLYTLPYGIVAVSVFTALMPTLSAHHVRGDMDSFREDLGQGLRITSFVMFPAAAGFVALSEPIVRLLLENGVFSSESTELFSGTFALMAIGLGAYAIFIQLMKAFVSMQDTRTPWIVNSTGVAINVIAAVILFQNMGVKGLGLAHSISYASALVIAVVVLQRRIGGLGGRSELSWHMRIGVAAAVTGVITWWVSQQLADSVDLTTLSGRSIQVGTAIVAGMVIYLATTSLMGINEARRLAALVTGRGRG
jgi:putative peptidoglycan lipid II flippase